MSIFSKFKKKKVKEEVEKDQKFTNSEVKVVEKVASPKKSAKTKLADEPSVASLEQEDEKAATEEAKTKKIAIKDKASIYAFNVLLGPVISEKSAQLHSQNQYVFKINPTANKVQVKQAIYELYNAKPVSIRIINMTGKKVIRGRVTGKTKAYKKAIVIMKKGVELPVYEGV
jgi:large subunit ribosomal protein L23